MSLGSKILSNTAWQIFGRLFTAVIGIVAVKIITNYLPTDAFGQYTTLYEYIGFFAIAADFGLYTIGVREMAKKERSVNEILANILSIRIVLIIVTLGLAGLIAQLIPTYQNTFVASGIWLVALTTALTLLHGTLSSVLQYKLKMMYANISVVVSRIISIAYIVFTIFYLHPSNIEQGFKHLLYAGIFANIGLLLTTIYYVSKEAKIHLDFNWKYTKELVVKSLPLGLALILSTIYFKIDVILIGLMRDYHEAGIYGVPLKIMEILAVIPVFFMNSALPAITEAFNKQKERFTSLLKRSYEFLLLAAVPMLIGGIILAYPLTFAISNPQFLSGYHCTNNIQIVDVDPIQANQICADAEVNQNFKWEQGKPNTAIYLAGSDIALRLLIIATFFAFISHLFSFAFVAMDKQIVLMVINLIGMIFNVVTNLILIPKYGFIGAAFTTILSELIILGAGYLAMRKLTEFRFPLKYSFKVLSAGLIMGAVVFALQPVTYQFLQNFNIFILIPLGGIVYLASLFAFKALDHEQVKRLLKFR